MNLQTVKNLIRTNNVFDTMDDASGSLQVPTGNFNSFEYGPSVFIGEGNNPPSITTTTQSWDKVSNLVLFGSTEDEIAKAYLYAFYSWLLQNQNANQPNKLQTKSVNNSNDIDNWFQGLPSMCSASTCLLCMHTDFTPLLNVPFGSNALRVIIQGGRKYFNVHLLSWGEPLVLLPGKKKNKLITAERCAIVLNQPQTLTHLGGIQYGTELQYKIIFPNEVKVFDI